MESKTAIRKQFLNLRMSLPIAVQQKKTASIIQNIEALLSENAWKKVFIYYPIKSEPNLLPLVASDSKKRVWALPCVDRLNNSMEFRQYENNQPLEMDKFGIACPVSSTIIKPDDQTLILVPAIAANTNGYRIGYGKGYYDGYLTKYRRGTVAVVLYSDCLTPHFEPEPHDIAASILVTDKGHSRVDV